MLPTTTGDIYSPALLTDRVLSMMAATDPEDGPLKVVELSTFLSHPQTVDQFAGALAYLEALSRMTADEITRLAARKRTIDETAYQIERAILTTMEAATITTIHGQHSMFRARTNPPTVRIEDAAAIPAQYMRQGPPPPPVPDKPAIRAAIEAEIFVPGAVLTRGTRLERK